VVLFFLAFIIFTGAMFGAAYYVWVIPQRQDNEILLTRLRQLRAQAIGTSRSAGGRGSSALIRTEQRGALALIGDFFTFIRPLQRLQEYINQADRKWRATEVFSLCVVIFLSFFLFFALLGMDNYGVRTLISLAIASLPVAYIVFLRNRRLHKFELAMPDAIDLFNRSMKAGHNIQSGLETLASETSEPVKGEFKRVIEELSLGSALEAALHNLGERVPLLDLRFFVIGLILQRQTGANMVVVLENLSLLVRERLNLAEKLKASTAQQRLSAGLLCALPIVVALVFWLLKPEYIRWFYTDETGQNVMTFAIIWESIGILVIRKMANPKF
jgi:tight adherence protein B